MPPSSSRSLNRRSSHRKRRGSAIRASGLQKAQATTRFSSAPIAGTPVHLGALGPEMLRLGGELADGVDLNWCTPDQIAWSRERVAEGAARAGRDPAAVQVTEYIRVCVDEDVEVARRAFARAVMGYALG